jgi:hypothetical protein
MNGRFKHFAAIDWSGAAGERHRGIAVALASAEGGQPAIVWPGQPWSRQDILDWMLSDLPADTLVGLDLGISLPFDDCGAFFPGWSGSPPDARALWQLVDETCVGDPHLSVNSFVEHPAVSRYFRRQGGLEGEAFHHPAAAHRRGRFRVTEAAQESRNNCRPYSNFNLVGAAQVGKSSLSGMRVLHRVNRRLPVWPIDDLPSQGSAIVEVYTTIAAIDAKRRASNSKMRTFEELNAALGVLGSAPVPGAGPIDDHSADALLTAAWLRAKSHLPELWNPQGMEAVRRTEGWTFGVA